MKSKKKKHAALEKAVEEDIAWGSGGGKKRVERFGRREVNALTR